MGTQGGAVHLNDLLLALGLYILLGLIGTLNYVAWGMAGAVGGSSNEGETDATRNARLFFVMGLVYPAMIVGYFALLDPGGTLASWSQCVPVLFAIVVWGKYLHGVLDAWAFLAVAVHLLWSLWLVHLVARTYVTSETLWEFGRRRIARARRG